MKPLAFLSSTLLFALITLSISAQVTPSAYSPPITAATFTPDGAAIFMGSQRGLTLYDFPALTPIKSLPTKLPSINDLKFSPDGKTLAVVGGFPAEGGMIELYQWPSAELIHRDHIHKDLVYAIAWAPESNQYATASADSLCYVFDATTHKKLQTFDGHSGPILAITYTHDGKSIISAGQDQTLRLWYAESASLRRSLHNHTNTVRDIAFQPPHEDRPRPYLASAGSDKTVRFWQPQIGRMVRFAKLPSPALAIAWRPTGDILLVSTQDGAVYTVNPDTVEVTQPFKPFDSWAYTLAMHPTGATALAAGRNAKALPLTINMQHINQLALQSQASKQSSLQKTPSVMQMKSLPQKEMQNQQMKDAHKNVPGMKKIPMDSKMQP